MYFDTHAHLDDAAFDEDRDEVLVRLTECGVDCVLDPGCDPESSRKAAALAEREDWIWFAAGIHPEELHAFTAEGLEQIAALLSHPKCRAVGEIGLDYYWDDTHKEEQKLVRQYPGLRGVFHCYSGSPEMAEELLRMGWYLGFDGPITYKNARKAIEVLRICPEDRILVETDSPYLAPVPRRGRRNDPGNLPYICAKIAEIREKSPEEIAALTAANGRRLFGIA